MPWVRWVLKSRSEGEPADPFDVAEDENEKKPKEDGNDPRANKDHHLHVGLIFGAWNRQTQLPSEKVLVSDSDRSTWARPLPARQQVRRRCLGAQAQCHRGSSRELKLKKITATFIFKEAVNGTTTTTNKCANKLNKHSNWTNVHFRNVWNLLRVILWLNKVYS